MDSEASFTPEEISERAAEVRSEWECPVDHKYTNSHMGLLATTLAVATEDIMWFGAFGWDGYIPGGDWHKSAAGGRLRGAIQAHRWIWQIGPPLEADKGFSFDDLCIELERDPDRTREYIYRGITPVIFDTLEHFSTIGWNPDKGLSWMPSSKRRLGRDIVSFVESRSRTRAAGVS